MESERLNLTMIRWLKVVILNLFIVNLSLGQQDLQLDKAFSKVYDKNLTEVKCERISVKKGIVFASNRSCAGCLEYFIKQKNKFGYIFLINSFSLMEIHKILQTYKLEYAKNIFFVKKEDVIYNELISSPTPCLFYETKYLSYELLDKLSNGFTKKITKQHWLDESIN